MKSSHTHTGSELGHSPRATDAYGKMVAGILVAAIALGVTVGQSVHLVLDGVEDRGILPALILFLIGICVVGGVSNWAHRLEHELEHRVEEEVESSSQTSRRHVNVRRGYAFLFLILSLVHVASDGVTLGLSAQEALLGVVALGAIALHESFRWLGSVVVLKQLGFSRRAAWLWTGGIAVLGMVGAAVLTYVTSRNFDFALVLPLAAGGTLMQVWHVVKPRLMSQTGSRFVLVVALVVVSAFLMMWVAEFTHGALHTGLVGESQTSQNIVHSTDVLTLL